MKRFVAFALFVAAAAGSGVVLQGAVPPDKLATLIQPPEAGQVVEAEVQAERLASARERLAAATEVGGRPVTTVTLGDRQIKAMAGEVIAKTDNPEALEAVGRPSETGLPATYKVAVPEQSDLAVVTEQVRALPGVQAAGPNLVVATTATPNDPLYSSQWALPKVLAPAAWDRTTGLGSVNIASIDTGVNWNHQDLSARAWVNTGEIPDNDIDDDNNGYVDDYRGMDFVNGTFSEGKYHNDADGPMDDHGHGSVTTGVFAAAANNGTGVAGLTWQGKYVPVKVLGSDGFGSFTDVAAGIRYASNVGAKVMNLSLGAFGVTSDFATDEAIDYAYGRGGVLVAASGNDGSTSVIDYPAYNLKVLAVGSTTSGDARSGFSNGGARLDLVAPGSGIMTTRGVVNGAPVNNQYASFSGTSMSTPYVSGTAALLAAINPAVPPDVASGILKNSTDKVAGMGGGAWTNLYGYGRLNARKALDSFNPWSAQWAGQSAYPTVPSGSQATVHVDFRNTGSQAWSNSGPHPVRLGTDRGRDRSSAFYTSGWISPSRPTTFTKKVNPDGSTTDTNTVQPGETARFAFTMTAPPVNAQTTFQEYLRPVVEGITWMQDYGVFLRAIVPARTYSYAWAGQTYPPAIMQPGERKPVTLNIRNTGTATWRKDTIQSFKVGTSRPRDRISKFTNNTWQSGSRVAKFEGVVSGDTVTPSDSVAPGQTARFSFDFVAPAQGGTYKEYFEPLIETYKWLGDVGISWTVTVPSQNYDYQYLGQSPAPVMTKGGTADAWVRLRNTGKQTWHSSGANAVKLGTQHPRDRQSGFSANGTSEGWLSSSRIKLTRNLTDPGKDVDGETSVAPGEIAEFEFTTTGAPQPGTYKEYFAPVVEGVQWMKDIGIFWWMTVEKPIEVGLAPQPTFTGTSDGPVNLINGSGTVLATLPAGTAITNSWNGSAYFGIWPGGSVSDPGPITVRQQSIHNILTVQNMGDNGAFNRFRGDLTIKNGGPGSWLVNRINLEEYLRGLGEVPDSWPLESIKAQTVAARTYAARRIENPQNALFQIYDTTQDQVYNGYNNEIAKPNHVTAIMATKGVVIRRDGQLIQAFYSSDSGGQTANNEDVWGGSPINYLRGKADPWERPDVWSKTVPNATIRTAYGHPGNVDGLNVTSWYGSGRPRTIQLVTSGGAVTNHTLPADTHRNRLTLRSSRVTGITRSGNDWVFHGRGFGHGIGMGQWGAFNQANAGRSYQQILQFYYTGVSLNSLY